MSEFEYLGLVINPGDECGLLRTICPDELHSLVGGYLEAVMFSDFHIYVDDEGKLKMRSLNAVATQLAIDLGWQPRGDFLVGTVVFLGNGPAGLEANVPQRVVDAHAALVANS